MTETIRHRYDRLAWLFDFMEAPMEKLRFGTWRARFKERVKGPKALEIGVGTGKNMQYYPDNVSVTAIDFSPRMLQKATERAESLGSSVQLMEMDAQHLALDDHTFDTVFAAFVFCSVPDPVQGLRELRRVIKPEGRLLLLEHMRPENWFLGIIFDLFNPIVVRLVGANINRRTIINIKRAGWDIVKEDHLSSDIVRWIEAVPSAVENQN